jgi:hypothetical protein
MKSVSTQADVPIDLFPCVLDHYEDATEYAGVALDL